MDNIEKEITCELDESDFTSKGIILAIKNSGYTSEELDELEQKAKDDYWNSIGRY